MLNKQNGFTLIELVIVITIIAILGTAGVFGITNYVERSKASTDIANARLLADAVSSAVADNKMALPAAGGGRLFAANAAGCAFNGYDLVAGGYINGTLFDVKGLSNTTRGWWITRAGNGSLEIYVVPTSTSTTGAIRLIPKPTAGYTAAPYSLVN